MNRPYSRIEVYCPHGFREELAEACELAGADSVAGLIRTAVRRYLVELREQHGEGDTTQRGVNDE